MIFEHGSHKALSNRLRKVTENCSRFRLFDVQGPFFGCLRFPPPHQLEFDALFGLRIALGPIRLAFEFERDRIDRIEIQALVAEFERYGVASVDLIG